VTSKVFVDMPICRKKTTVVAEKDGDDKVKITFETDCEHIRELSQNLKSIKTEDAFLSFGENPVYLSAISSNLTPTCLVPCGIMNAVWVETGLISRSLTQNETTRELKLKFL
jgi:hypothetical protein